MKVNLSTIGSGYGATAALNANFDAIEAAIENTLSRDGTTPNEMEANLDMNDNNILNVNALDVASLTINGTPVQPSTGVTVASAFQTHSFVATASQTSFSVSPYTPYVASVLVEVNGLSLPPAEISVSGTNVVIPACSVGDEVVIRRYTDAPSPFPSASDISFNQAGTIQTRTVQSKLRDTVSVKDFGAVGDGVVDDTAAIQAAIDSKAGALQVLLPPGVFKTTSTIYLRRNGVHIVGYGPAVSCIKFVNVSGGIVFAGDANTYNSTAQYESCALEDFEVLSSGSAATDASIIVDLSSFSYSHFNIEAQTRRAGGVIYYGQGNAGVAPYYNHIESTGLFGGLDYTQTAFQFRGGAFGGGSNGPNANIIGPITRAASLDILADIRVGQANLFHNISGESIGGAYFILGGNASVSSGTSTGSNTENTFKDTGKSWATNAFVNGAVQITAGAGQGQVRQIRTNTSNTLTIYDSWASIPDATSQYAIYEGKALKNKFVNLRAEGLDSLNPDFIYAFPGANYNEFSQMSVESLGSGKQVVDASGCASNVLYGPNKFIYTHTFTNPGASANINAFPRLSVWGGLPIAGDYVIEWMRVNVDYFSHGDTATVRLDAGGNAVGAGVQTLAVAVPDNQSQGMALPLSTQKLVRSGTNEPLFLNLQTGAAFSAGRSVIVTICVTLI